MLGVAGILVFGLMAQWSWKLRWDWNSIDVPSSRFIMYVLNYASCSIRQLLLDLHLQMFTAVVIGYLPIASSQATQQQKPRIRITIQE